MGRPRRSSAASSDAGLSLVLLLLAALLATTLLPEALNLQLLTLGSLFCFWLAGEMTHRRALLPAAGSGLALATLAMLDPATWVGTAAALLLMWGIGQRPRSLGVSSLAVGLGAAFPLVLLTVMALSDEPAQRAVLGAFGGPRTATEWTRKAATLLACVSLGVWALHCAADRYRPASQRPWRAPPALEVAAALALVCFVGLRAVWLGSEASLRTDLRVWSEAPLLVNLLKLRAGEVLYGAFELVNSYSYSPGLELCQYSMLRPFGLELSLRAHRLLGIGLQLGSAGLLFLGLRSQLQLKRRQSWLLASGLAATSFSSFLAPHLHPDHALLLCFAAALWVVLDGARHPWAERILLLTIPPLAAIFKLTGAGIGLGLLLAYAWQRDWRGVVLVGAGGLLAVGTIPLFDATLGRFSAYAIELQASHSLEWFRAPQIPSAPAGRVFSVSLLALLWRWRADAPRVRAAVGVMLVTCAFGAVSLFAYVKHGGRANSLMPLAIGGSVVLVLCLYDALVSEPSADTRRGLPTGAAVLVLSLALLVTPSFEPIPPSARDMLEASHDAQVAWLRAGAASGKRYWRASIAAYIDSGQREVPRDVLGSAAELALADRPEFRAFQRRMLAGHYDGISIGNSELLSGEVFASMSEALRRDYTIVAPAELAGSWPTRLGGYSVLERKPPSAPP